MAGTLYVVATPIGNLEDITLRGISILKDVDLIAAEDTRHTRRLLDRHGLNGKMVSYHDHNEATRSVELVTALLAGQSVALVSDAGTPTISDPGYRLIRLAGEADITVSPIPGPSAGLAALSVSGLPTDRFLFEGFLPRKKGRSSRLKELADFQGTVVIYESAVRIKGTLKDILTAFGPREAVLARELTKVHETVLRGSVGDILDAVERKQPKGECVILISKQVSV